MSTLDPLFWQACRLFIKDILELGESDELPGTFLFEAGWRDIDSVETYLLPSKRMIRKAEIAGYIVGKTENNYSVTYTGMLTDLKRVMRAHDVD